MSFIRLNITAEGHAEEVFIKEPLYEYLLNFNIFVDVRKVRTGSKNGIDFRGGLKSYAKAKYDIEKWLKEESNPECRFSTMFDYYALPTSFPKYAESQEIKDPYKKIAFLEQAFKDDIGDYRFIPYIQLHEFEALILAKPENLDYEYFDYKKEIAELKKVLNEFSCSELINNKPETAPSKRILNLIPEYEKVAAGAYLAGLEGIPFLKENCRHFGEWINKLEKLNN